ncbi:N-methyl-L-tryptophan oxidase-like [Glandiceps talaboti]
MEGHNINYYDICIVGAGMIGSAAARHVTLISPSLKVCLIGPKEPKERHGVHHGIFGAHYDEGRITRSLDPDPIWAELGQRSIARYRDLEQRTGVQFFREVGQMSVSAKGDAYIENVKRNTQTMKLEASVLDKEGVQNIYPFLSINPDDEAVLQSKDAGHVSPRAQIVAQQTAAHLQGCDIIDDVVDQVTETNQSDGSKCMKAITAKGQVILAGRILLTTGAFTGFRNLLPKGKELDVTLLTQTVALIEVTSDDAKRLKDMPCLIVKHNEGTKYDGYILPPIKYPNGKYYLKVGHGNDFERELHTAAEVADWYKTDGDKFVHQPLLDKIFHFVKGVQAVSTHGDCCVTTHTPTDQIYCDMITPTLGITTGGNGYAAKSADEIGRMAARMIIAGCWDHDLPRDNFRVRFKVKPQVIPAKL